MLASQKSMPITVMPLMFLFENPIFFFGSYSETITETTLPVDADTCSLMVRRMMSPKNTPLLRIRDDAFGTQEVSKLEYSWPHTLEEHVINYYYNVITVSANNVDEQLIAPVPLLAPCHIYDNKCKTSDNGVLIYEGAEFQVCRLLRGASSKCLYSDNSRISCPELSIAINQLPTSTICGANIGTSGQGILWTQDLLNEVNGEVATTDQVDLLTRPERSLGKRRQVPDFASEQIQPLYVSTRATSTRRPLPNIPEDSYKILGQEEVLPLWQDRSALIRMTPLPTSLPTLSTTTTTTTPENILSVNSVGPTGDTINAGNGVNGRRCHVGGAWDLPLR